MRRIILAGALALGLAGAAAAQSTMPHSGMSRMDAAPGDAAAALPTADYIMKAGQSDQFEIQEGQMAASMGRSPGVREFGRMMIAAHRRTTATLTQAIAGMGQTPSPPPPPLTADQQAQIDQLRGLSGPAFDRAYLDQQLSSHHEALTVQANYARGGSDAKLRQVARSTVPIVQAHLDRLAALQARTAAGT